MRRKTHPVPCVIWERDDLQDSAVRDLPGSSRSDWRRGCHIDDLRVECIGGTRTARLRSSGQWDCLPHTTCALTPVRGARRDPFHEHACQWPEPGSRSAIRSSVVRCPGEPFRAGTWARDRAQVRVRSGQSAGGHSSRACHPQPLGGPAGEVDPVRRCCGLPA